jgi:hypothetical protein
VGVRLVGLRLGELVSSHGLHVMLILTYSSAAMLNP